MTELKKTIPGMTSADYKERFVAEYQQTETRYLKLKKDSLRMSWRGAA